MTTEWISVNKHGITKSAGWDTLTTRLKAELVAKAAVSAPGVACAHIPAPEDA